MSEANIQMHHYRPNCTRKKSAKSTSRRFEITRQLSIALYTGLLTTGHRTPTSVCSHVGLLPVRVPQLSTRSTFVSIFGNLYTLLCLRWCSIYVWPALQRRRREQSLLWKRRAHCTIWRGAQLPVTRYHDLAHCSDTQQATIRQRTAVRFLQHLTPHATSQRHPRPSVVQ